MTREEKEAAYQCLLKLRDAPVPLQMTEGQEKAYIDWHGSEERRKMLEAAIASLTEGIDPPANEIPVNWVNPPHYKGKRFESIDIIEDFDLGFHLGNAIKYILRAGKKGDKVLDLRKAIWYLERECANAVGETAGCAEERK